MQGNYGGLKIFHLPHGVEGINILESLKLYGPRSYAAHNGTLQCSLDVLADVSRQCVCCVLSVRAVCVLHVCCVCCVCRV